MMFQDRADAAARLADALSTYHGSHPMVLAIPRGAVPMGRIVADRLGGELDVVLVRKLGAPWHAELAVGAVDESGWIYVTPFAEAVGASPAYIEEERNGQLALLRQRRALYTPRRSAYPLGGRTVIVLDDGLATGATMIAALHAARQQQPARLICAVPVAAPDSLALVRGHADEVVCLYAPASFRAVGEHYQAFAQVDDSEVVACLAGDAAAGHPKPARPLRRQRGGTA
ncbi:phosphoribosyltransferase family protein [Cupriavidus basilensis]|uniref:Phosphoribosyltransferase family protein n=1 Tax=Cupriavidus basilensis TaxID=68895 RepID=A0ABT6ALB0_9BURK|nr:phosphoribosyltransferase family protein [Cupriavidus basilensis]MDF3833393.1 phosphoribosyltransferase family protein [Cupriavidus basilensis]